LVTEPVTSFLENGTAWMAGVTASNAIQTAAAIGASLVDARRGEEAQAGRGQEKKIHERLTSLAHIG
jgi:hypothetical protein